MRKSRWGIKHLLYKHETQNRALRNRNTINNDINLTDTKKAYCQNALFYNGIRLYNSLPDEK